MKPMSSAPRQTGQTLVAARRAGGSGAVDSGGKRQSKKTSVHPIMIHGNRPMLNSSAVRLWKITTAT